MRTLLLAGRALVATTARSLVGQPIEVTLPQFRVLVVLDTQGPQRIVDITRELGVDASVGTRMCERLVRKGLVTRERSAADKRVVIVTLSPAGQELVTRTREQRRAALAVAVAAMPPESYDALIQALGAFTAAAGDTAKA